VTAATVQSPTAPTVAANEPMRGHEWMTAAEAADYLRLPTTNALYQRVARGQVKPLRLGRQMRFRRRDLDALMDPAVGAPRYAPDRCAPSPGGTRRW
jgi:excisionase family DNA binding protein